MTPLHAVFSILFSVFANVASLSVSDFLGLIAQPLFIDKELTKEDLLNRQPRGNCGVFCLCSLSLNNDNTKCRSISGASLSHGICYFSD